MPLLTELSDWRTKLNEIEDQLDDELDITFVADFPGMAKFKNNCRISHRDGDGVGGGGGDADEGGGGGSGGGCGGGGGDADGDGGGS